MDRSVEEKKKIEQIDNTNEYIYSNSGSIETNLNELVKLSSENIDLSQSLNYYEGLVKAYYLLGDLYTKIGLVNEAIDALNKSENVLMKFELPKEHIVRLNNYWYVLYFRLIGDYGKGIEYLKKGIEIAKKAKLNELHVLLTMNLGVAYAYTGLFEDALESYKFALDHYIKTDDKKIIYSCYNNMGWSYLRAKDYEKAYSYLKKANTLSIEHKDLRIIFDSTKGLAKMNFERGNKEEACALLEDTINKLHHRSIVHNEIELSLDLIGYYIEMNEYNATNERLPSLKKLILSTDNKQYMSRYYQYETALHELQGNIEKALYSYKKYKEVQEKVNNEEAKNKLERITNENMRNLINRLNVIADVGRDITSNLDLEKAVYAIYKHVNNMMKADVFGIAYLDKDVLNYELFIENDKKIPVLSRKLTDCNSFGVWCINNDKEIIINDLEREYSNYVRDVSFLLTGENDPQSLIFIPLKLEEKIIGIISVQSYDKNAYLLEDFETLKILATYIAIALKNAKQSHELKILSTVDELTNLYNRRYFNTQMNKLCEKSTDECKQVALMILDIDFFKKVNDVYGHPAGDIILKQVSSMLVESFEDFAELVARIGGEEFAVLLYDKDLDQLLTYAEKFRKVIEELEIKTEGKVIGVTISIGISLANETTAEMRKTLFTNADEALYISKNNGRNQVNFNTAIEI